MASCGIPFLLPYVEWKGHMLIDGGLTDNFGMEYAQATFPDQRIFGLALGSYGESMKVLRYLSELFQLKSEENMKRLISGGKLLAETKNGDYSGSLYTLAPSVHFAVLNTVYDTLNFQLDIKHRTLLMTDGIKIYSALNAICTTTRRVLEDELDKRGERDSR